jgi:urease accessory protein
VELPRSPEASRPVEPIGPSELVRLLQLTSPALPIGAFAFSQGLESAVELGFIQDEASARDWLAGTLQSGMVLLDLPVLLRLHAAWCAGDAGSVERWSAFLLASRETAERRDEDQKLGRALARLLSDQGVAAAAGWLERETVTHACLFALAASAYGIREEAAALGFAFSWAENQVGALSRLVPLGQLAAQRVLSAVGAQVPGAVARARTLADAELGVTLPGLALASALHETQYTRLFKS